MSGLHRLAATVDMGQAAETPQQPIIIRAKLHELVASVAPGERFEPCVELVHQHISHSCIGIGKDGRVFCY
jgi:hypothetical protein